MFYKKQWEFLKNKFESSQIAHAYLLAGEEGIGKKFFAKEFASLVGCKFPDLITVGPGGEREISIAKIREIQKFLAYKSYYEGFRIIIVDNAHLMNQQAQSCFLKTLEEPKGKTIVFLISSKPDALLPTIISRCQTLKFFKPANLPVDVRKTEKEQKILKDLLGVINSGFSEKFRYIKSLDFSAQGEPASGEDEYSAQEIITVLQKHFRKQLLNDFSDPHRLSEAGKKAKKALELSEEISQKLLFTNANSKLALEVLLMEL